MNITNKSRFGIKVLIYIAETGFVQRRQIASSQNIGIEWLDQILLRLRACGIIQSKRGPTGGYSLVEGSRQFNVWQILSSLEDWQVPVKCLDDDSSCSLNSTCNSRTPWQLIYYSIKESLEKISFETLIDSSSAASLNNFSINSLTNNKVSTRIES